MMQVILRSYWVHKGLLPATILSLSYFRSSKRSYKGEHHSCPRDWYGEHPCIVTAQCMQFLVSYGIHKVTWPCTTLKIQKGHTKINVKLLCDFGVENNPVRLPNNACNSWRVITFTRPFDLQINKVMQKSTSDLVKIFMLRTLLPIEAKSEEFMMFTRGCYTPPFE